MYLSEDPELSKQWSPLYGDRINKVVFIGIEMDREAIVSSLDGCLLNDDELQQDWMKFKDGLPNIQ
ncbi:putative metal chaperone YciC [compost metagenome]